MTSLGLSTITTTQVSKEAAINTIFGQVEDRIINTVSVEMSDTTSSYLLSSANQQRNYRILCTEDVADSPSTARDLTFTDVPGIYLVENQSSVAVNLKISTTTYYVLADEKQVLIYNTGSALRVIAVSGATVPATVGIYHRTEPTASVALWGFIFTEAMTLPVSLAGSQFRADTAPSGGAVALTLHKNGGSSLGSISFADASNTATVTFTTATDFAVGDRLEIIAPASTYGIAELMLSLLFSKKVTE